MAFYWTAGQLPEFAGVPKDRREAVLEAAVFSLPITWKSLGVVVGAMVPMVALGLALAHALGTWVVCCWLPAAVFLLNAVLVNLARPRIRALVRTVQHRREGASP
jgi:hypothetical protein